MTNRFGGNIPSPYFLGEHPVRRLYIGSHSLWVANPLEATLLASGAFTYSGYGMDSYVPELESGLFSFEGGEDTKFQSDLSVLLEDGSFSLTGFEIAVDIGSMLVADSGSFVLTGFELGTSLHTGIAFDSGSYSVNGFDISLDVPLNVGAFVLTGFDATFDHNTGAPTDPNFANVILLVGAEGADGSNTFIDESPLVNTITPFGHVQIDTAQSKFGLASALFDGSGDRFTIPYGNFATADFTIELFMRFTAINNAARGNTILNQYSNSGTQTRLYFKLHTETGGTGRALRFSYVRVGGTTFFTDSLFTPTLNTWYHIAIDRAGSVIRTYVDGVMIGKVTEAPNHLFSGTVPVEIGRIAQTVVGFTADHNGHMDEIRVTDGVARYASDAGFTVPTAAYPRS